MSSDRQPVTSGGEIERKFLVQPTHLPDNIDRYPHDLIQQGYLAVTSEGGEVRVRRKGDRGYLTVKSGGDLQRSEHEVELTPQQFQQLWPATEGRRLEKTRYLIRHGDHLIELDVYHASLTGLSTAEVEFTSIEASQSFQPPAWFFREVTQDSRYKNRNLALHGRPADA